VVNRNFEEAGDPRSGAILIGATKKESLMAGKDTRVDAYIASSAGFARPILTHLRKVVHGACPGVEEDIKWGTPHFLYKGMLCSMAAFTSHCAFGFWKGSLLADEPGKLAKVGNTAMGQFGRITTLEDLPDERTLTAYVKKAARLNEDGVKAPVRKRTARARPIKVPADLARLLKKHRRSLAAFEGFSPTNKREYIEWIEEAKTGDTRAKRLATAIEWMAEGKVRNWKYVK
jgi:uncharacterized protein YdeI (YjbR/CyaY-like superfamily)